MKITDALLAEHAIFYALFDRLEELNDETDSIAALQFAMDLLAPVLVSHAKVEDELLFPRLESRRKDGPLGAMRSEHQQIEDLFAGVHSVGDLDALRGRVQEMIDVAREHFQKEDEIVLPVAVEAVEEDALERLGQQWARLRQVSVD
jgi:hemerythrin-like domain-containing protein